MRQKIHCCEYQSTCVVFLKVVGLKWTTQIFLVEWESLISNYVNSSWVNHQIWGKDAKSSGQKGFLAIWLYCRIDQSFAIWKQICWFWQWFCNASPSSFHYFVHMLPSNWDHLNYGMMIHWFCTSCRMNAKLEIPDLDLRLLP